MIALSPRPLAEPRCSWLVNHIPPRLLMVGTVHGEPIDIRGLAAVRAVLATGQGLGIGRRIGLQWGLCEADRIDGTFRAIRRGPLASGADGVRGLSWVHVSLAVPGRKRWVRAELKLTGDGTIVAGVTLQLFAPGEEGRIDLLGTDPEGLIRLPTGHPG